MADHWVAEVFPPRFQFSSVDEMLQNNKEDETENKRTHTGDEVYRKVYYDEEKAKKPSDEQSNSKRRRARGKRQTDPSDASRKEKKIEMKSQTNNDDECIWSQSELKMLRKFLQKAKMQNLQLAALLQSAQSEIRMWKEKFKDVTESEDLVENRYQVLKKKYERLKVNYRALKEDVRKYHNNLKVTRRDYQELQNEKNDIEKSFNETKLNLNREKLHSERLQAKLERREREFEESLKRCEFFLEQQHLIEKTKLQRDIDRLREECEKEKEENSLNKKALEHLRTHFANLQILGDSTERSKETDNVLSVVDIDYLPK